MVCLVKHFVIMAVSEGCNVRTVKMSLGTDIDVHCNGK